jgi:hypothetical protein
MRPVTNQYFFSNPNSAHDATFNPAGFGLAQEGKENSPVRNEFSPYHYRSQGEIYSQSSSHQVHHGSALDLTSSKPDCGSWREQQWGDYPCPTAGQPEPTPVMYLQPL